MTAKKPHSPPPETLSPSLRAEVRELLSTRPAPAPEDAALLNLMAAHDANLGAALAKLPERDGVGGAALAALVKKYRGSVDAYEAARTISSALIFWPDPIPGDDRLEEAVLRLADFSLDAARELAHAFIYLGPRFTLQYSLRVLLEKYGIGSREFYATANLPTEGLTSAALESMLAQGQIELINEVLRPYQIVIRQKIGTVRPVFSLIEGANGRHVMPAEELLEFLRKRNVFV